MSYWRQKLQCPSCDDQSGFTAYRPQHIFQSRSIVAFTIFKGWTVVTSLMCLLVLGIGKLYWRIGQWGVRCILTYHDTCLDAWTNTQVKIWATLKFRVLSVADMVWFVANMDIPFQSYAVHSVLLFVLVCSLTLSLKNERPKNSHLFLVTGETV